MTKSWNIRNAADVQEVQVMNIGFPTINRGALCILGGQRESRKTFALCGLASSLTRGNSPTGGTITPCKVLYLSGEDTAEDLTQRMKTCGADLQNVQILGLDETGELLLSRNKAPDMSQLEDIYTQSNAPDVIFIDPLQTFYGVSGNDGSLLRPIVTELMRLARRHNCAIVGVLHPRKVSLKGVADINDELAGTSEVANVARAIWTVVRLDDDRSVLVNTKSSQTKRAVSMEFSTYGGVFKWEGFSDITKEDIEAASRSQYKSNVREYMQSGQYAKAHSAREADERRAIAEHRARQAAELCQLVKSQKERREFWAYQRMNTLGIQGITDIEPLIDQLDHAGIIVEKAENPVTDKTLGKQGRGVWMIDSARAS